MKKMENWVLDGFMPWFMGVSQYVGVLAILFGLSYCIGKLLGLEGPAIFVMTIINGFLLWCINDTAKDSRLMRGIKELLDEENDNVQKIVKEKNLVDYPELDSIILRIRRKLNPETLAAHRGEVESGGIDKVYKKISEAVWSRYRGISHKKKMEEANTQRIKNNEQKGV